ncbi:MAG TPA: CHRD domain-containing protein [Gaiellaceae bacterium]|nr:CHRD domain-containing protein [Gaiellaceae bacterium]
MRRAMLAAALVLGLSVVGVAAAQYGDSNPTPPAAQPASAGAEKYTYRAPMNSGLEVPKPKGAHGSGLFTATVTESGSSIALKWKLTFKGLTGKAVAAHIHKGKPGKAGAVLVPLCSPCRSGQTGSMQLSESQNSAIEKGGTYANVHTPKNAAGEIRGQVKLVAHA